MEAVLIHRGTVLHFKGIPIQLAHDAIVETSYGNMQFLVGHHYAHLPDAEEGKPTTSINPTNQGETN